MAYKFLILGCTGEIGSLLTKLLLRQGHIIYGISGSRNCKINHPRHRCQKINLLKELNLFEVIDFKPEILIHTAWLTDYRTYRNSEVNFEWLNISKKIISDFAVIGGQYLVVTSTCFEYSWEGKHPLSENSIVAPNTNYGISKFKLLEWIETTNIIPYLWTRIFFQFGPTENFGRFIPSLIDTLKSGNPFYVNSPNEIRDYVYIFDVANILILLINKYETGIFNIGTGIGTSSRTIANLVSSIMKKENLVIFNQENKSESTVVSNTSKLIQSLNHYKWVPIESSILLSIKSRISGSSLT
jgi:nucleoside-diphosphate-sugar epimerase